MIYLVSVLGSGSPAGGYRVWGYYMNRADALMCIKENQTDISELGYYRWGILSAMPEGPLAMPEGEQEWYEFVWEKGTLAEVKQVPPPEEFENTLFTF